jgi:hypothetical protein
MSDLAKTSKVLLLEEINLKNGNQFAITDLDFGIPAVTTEQSRNTKVRINSSANSQYSGWQDVWYNRLDIDELFRRFGASIVELPSGGVNNYLDVLHLLNLTYGLAIQDDEVVDTPIVNNQIDLTIAPRSLAFYGRLKIKLLGAKTPIDSAISVQVLDGLWYPDAIVDHLITPVVLEGSLLGKAVAEDGNMHNESLPDNMLIATNNELELAIRAEKTGGEINPIGDKYYIEVASEEDWGVTFSMALLSTQINDKFDELYSVRMYIRLVGTDTKVEFVLSRDIDGVYTFVNSEIDVTLSGFTQTDDGLVVQSSMLARSLTDLISGISVNNAGAGLGDFELGLIAYRRNSIVPRVAAIAFATVSWVNPA